MSGPTPGPWVLTVYHSPAGKSFDVRCAGSGNRVANVSEDGDARLIAAAPDLLEALKACYVLAPHDPPKMRSEAVLMAMAAIAKAEGR